MKRFLNRQWMLGMVCGLTLALLSGCVEGEVTGLAPTPMELSEQTEESLKELWENEDFLALWDSEDYARALENEELVRLWEEGDEEKLFENEEYVKLFNNEHFIKLRENEKFAHLWKSGAEDVASDLSESEEDVSADFLPLSALAISVCPPIIDEKLVFNQSSNAIKLTNRTDTKVITLHHTVGTYTTAKKLHDAHKKNKNADKKYWPGIAYHFFINKSGKVYKGREWLQNAGSTDNDAINKTSLAIAFDGDFENKILLIFKPVMSDAQRNAGIALIKCARNRYSSIKSLNKHKDVDNTKCPGQFFPFNEIKQATGPWG